MQSTLLQTRNERTYKRGYAICRTTDDSPPPYRCDKPLDKKEEVRELFVINFVAPSG